jgi:acyl-CoA thioesterase-2
LSDFYLVEPGRSPFHHRLTVLERYTVAGPDNAFLFGGAALGACILAAERSIGRETVWASAQYLSYARLGTEVEIEILPVTSGRYTSQARAVARIDAEEIIGVSLSLGARPGFPERQFARPEPLPPPETCPKLPIRWSSMPGDIYGHLDARIASGWDKTTDGGGSVSLWIRPIGNVPIDRPLLALVSDFVAAAISNMLGSDAGDNSANSLDNSIRFIAPVQTSWIQCDIRLHGAANGFAHGCMLLFTPEGQLMASASQSVMLRNILYPRT